MKRQTLPKFSTLLLFLLILQGSATYAQRDTTYQNPDTKNIIKVNVTSILLKTYVFQYERAVGKNTAVALGFSFMPKSGPPLKSKIEDLVDDQETWDHIKDYQSANFAITPEFRYYFGKKGVFQGFYIAPFVRFAKYDVDVPFRYSYLTANETLPMSGSINTVTGGLLFGAQWKLSKVVYLDWWILGPNYGASSGSLTGMKVLNEQEEAYLRDELEGLSDIPLVDTKYTVNGNGVKVDIDGPWAGLRAGINVGFRF